MEAAYLAMFLKFGNANKLDICVFFAKKSWVATKLKGLEQNWGAVPPGPGLKPPLPTFVRTRSKKAVVVFNSCRRHRITIYLLPLVYWFTSSRCQSRSLNDRLFSETQVLGLFSEVSTDLTGLGRSTRFFDATAEEPLEGDSELAAARMKFSFCAESGGAAARRRLGDRRLVGRCSSFRSVLLITLTRAVAGSDWRPATSPAETISSLSRTGSMLPAG